MQVQHYDGPIACYTAARLACITALLFTLCCRSSGVQAHGAHSVIRVVFKPTGQGALGRQCQDVTGMPGRHWDARTSLGCQEVTGDHSRGSPCG
jgi:hypothetical protein